MVGAWGPMGGEGAVELSTQFTQTALSARGEALHRQMNGGVGGREGERERELVREAEREEGMEMDGGPEDEWRVENCRREEGYTVGEVVGWGGGVERTPVSRLDRQRVR